MGTPDRDPPRPFPGLPNGDNWEPPGPPRQPSQTFWIAVAGAILIAVGGYSWLATASIASACSSALVQAADSSCSDYMIAHTIAGVGALLGLVLVVVAIVRS